MPDGKREWIVDPSQEECQSLSNNLVLVIRVGEKVITQVGADMNRSSYSVQNSQNLNFKSSTISFNDLRGAIKLSEAICQKALMQSVGLDKAKYEIIL